MRQLLTASGGMICAGLLVCGMAFGAAAKATNMKDKDDDRGPEYAVRGGDVEMPGGRGGGSEEKGGRVEEKVRRESCEVLGARFAPLAFAGRIVASLLLQTQPVTFSNVETTTSYAARFAHRPSSSPHTPPATKSACASWQASSAPSYSLRSSSPRRCATL